MGACAGREVQPVEEIKPEPIVVIDHRPSSPDVKEVESLVMPACLKQASKSMQQDMNRFASMKETWLRQARETSDVCQQDCSHSFRYEQTGSVYSGCYVHGHKHGWGQELEVVWSDKQVDTGRRVYFEGLFVQDSKEQFGLLLYPDGDYYFGEIRNGRPHGQGKFVNSNGNVYEGEWVDGHQEGLGKETSAGGAVYEGQFQHSAKHGMGVYTQADKKTRYEGQFDKGNINGTGTYMWSDGRCYTGDWKDNMMHGRGKYSWPDERYYEGDYVLNKKHGRGKMVWSRTGKVYDGEWTNGKQNGQANFKMKDDAEAIQTVWREGIRVK